MLLNLFCLNLNHKLKLIMEALMSYEGYKLLRDKKKANELVDRFLEDQGYTIAKPKKSAKSEGANEVRISTGLDRPSKR